MLTASRSVPPTNNFSKSPARNQSRAASLLPMFQSLAHCLLLPIGTARKLSSGITGIAKSYSLTHGTTLARALYQARIQRIRPLFPFVSHSNTNRSSPSPTHRPNSNSRSPHIKNHTLTHVFSHRRGQVFELVRCSLFATYEDDDDSLRTQNGSKRIR
jgi:hypothetical protein